MRPILDPFGTVVFTLKYCPHGEAYLSPPNSNHQLPTDNQQLPQPPDNSTLVTTVDLTPLQG
jgi:hypothetical protein